MRPFIEVLPQNARQNGRGMLVDGRSVGELLSGRQTPLYVTSLRAVAARANCYLTTLRGYFPNGRVYYAVKANFAREVLNAVRETGCGADIVSGGEWLAARGAGFEGRNICFAGVGKLDSEWKSAIADGLGVVNVEHIEELDEILDWLAKNPAQVVVALRLNPCVESKTHPHLKTGALDSKFGILFEHFSQWLLQKKNSFSDTHAFEKHLAPLKGIHAHVGSQIENPEVLKEVIRIVLSTAEFMRQHALKIDHIDLGGGLHVAVSGVPEDGSDIKNHVGFLANSLLETSRQFPGLVAMWGADLKNLTVSLEPGRSMVASSTVFFTKVLFQKSNSAEHNFCYVDAGMNDFPRPSMYGATHDVILADMTGGARDAADTVNYKIVGPVCESADILSKSAVLPRVVRGDILAFFEGGAYCRSMASNYNCRPFPGEIFI